MRDIEEELKKAAEKVDVPDMLEPDIMQLRLDARGRRSERESERSEETKASAGPSRVTNEEKGSATDVSEGGKVVRISGNDRTDSVKAAKAFTDRAEAEKARKKRMRRGLATAAAAVLLVGLSSWLTYDHFEKKLEEAGTSLEEVAAETETVKDAEGADAEPTTAAIERHDAGSMYVLAKTEKAYTNYVKKQVAAWNSYTTDEVATDSISDNAASTNASSSSSTADSATTGSEGSKAIQESADTASGAGNSGSDYSYTNTLVEGVDEADIAKTDGRYIYRVVGESIKVTRADGTALTRCDDINMTNDTIAAVRKAAGTSGSAEEGTDTSKDSSTENDGSQEGTAGVSVPKKVADIIESCSVSINEMFVRDGKLIVLGNLYKYGLNPNASATPDLAADASYRGVADTSTKLLGIFTYDISDPEHAVLKSVDCIDGYYNQARITSDGKLIVFAYNWMDDDQVVWPQIDGEKIGADSIYLPAEGLNQTIIAAFDLAGDGLKAIDSCMIMNNYATPYVTDDAIYLYGYDSASSGSDATNVARFTFKDGKIDAAGAATVSGTVTDDYALRVVDDNLFILTTTYNYSSSDTSNGLYVYDAEMKRRGALTGLAPGETIYSARYIGKMAYFVTYRQTDPLFAVDISNPDDPKLLGYLKITGFSDYLHPWSENRLVGLGLETDPDTGEQKGIKLSMFDVSDPTNPVVVGSTVIPAKYSDLYTYDHRAVLASADKNLLGFGYSYTNDDYATWKTAYAFYSWNEATKTFDAVYTADLDFNGVQSLRGLYIGDDLYISEPDGVEVKGGEKLLY